MALDTADWTVAVNGDIRWTGGGGAVNVTVIELHRFLQDLADDAAAAGDDLLDITDETPSDRSTDNIITLINSYNIDDTAAEHIYDGSITQTNGDVIYSGLVVVGAAPASTELQIVQDNALLTSFWGTGLNPDTAASILLRILVKTRTGAADIDGQRIRVQARELGDTYAEFSVTMGLGNNTAAVFTATDLNNQTAAGTIAALLIVNDNEGYIGLDVTGDAVDEFYYSNWDLNGDSINDLYEYTKWQGRRGTAETVYGLGGGLFRGITHELTVDTPTGTFSAVEAVSWTGGTGQMLAINSTTAATLMWIQLLTGVVPTDGLTITGGTSAATVDLNVTVTPRTLSAEFVGVSTGSAIIGAYGIGVDPADLTSSDQLFDLTNTLRVPPNNVVFSVAGLVTSEDRVLVGPEDGAGGLDLDQMALNATLTGAAVTSIVMTASIPTDTPSSGTIRVEVDSGVYFRIAYSSFTGSTFTVTATDFSTDNATAANNAYISYLDLLATAASETFTVVYNGDRTLFIRVRDGGGTPIRTFETTGVLGSGGGSTTVIRTSDA